MSFFNKNCLTKINNTKFWIKDDKPNQPAYLTTNEPEKREVKVTNKETLDLEFYAIDYCIIFRNERDLKESTCDAALKHKDDFIFFLELKNRTYSGWLSKAIKQLENTLSLYNKSEVHRAKNIKCFVCNTQRPRATESCKGLLAKFKMQNNCMLEVSHTITIN